MTDPLILFAASSGLLLVVWFVPPLAHRCLQRLAWRRSGRIALTYDDGPGKVMAPRLLDLLEEYHAPATFFLLGRRAQQHPETVRQIAQAGHEVGTHSMHHLHAWRTSPWRSARDLAADGWAQSLLGFVPRLVRPPYGKMTLATWLVSVARGRRIAWWSIDAGDTWPQLPTPASVVQRVIQARGGVVLLHDFDREDQPDQAARQEFVLAVTRGILEAGSKAGLRFCRYSDVLASSPARGQE